MIPSFTTLTFFVLWASGVSHSVLIPQWPQYISSFPSGSAEMHCYQNDTDYQYMYWYQQLRGTQLQLVVYVVGSSAIYEEGFKSGFEAKIVQKKQWSLKIPSAQRKDEAVYLCAASLHSAVTDTNFQSEAYFGAGTKLTVLEHEVKAPNVTVLRPSAKECRNPLDNERQKTLVCVASGFYPDHVSVFWQVDDQTVTSGVATDEAAVQDGKSYKITSRLRVAAEDWYKPERTFECFVSFFNGKEYTNHSSPLIFGEPAPDILTREEYLRITTKAKLSYGVFIIKSCVYGAFVTFLVWRLQSSTEKQRN
ncbi:M1-specific T cell receptor beta chain [Hippoglossus stenolepis]|uniref:M1-specific T cell receptor beta chain n=1 Tax=Hippoglossus stenolepis TaxID=195615 RepID=UPI001FAFBA16|nr:M1-specific T cell receptor beta chain [Hippoglossus stenolepis]